MFKRGTAEETGEKGEKTEVADYLKAISMFWDPSTYTLGHVSAVAALFDKGDFPRLAQRMTDLLSNSELAVARLKHVQPPVAIQNHHRSLQAVAQFLVDGCTLLQVSAQVRDELTKIQDPRKGGVTPTVDAMALYAEALKLQPLVKEQFRAGVQMLQQAGVILQATRTQLYAMQDGR